MQRLISPRKRPILIIDGSDRDEYKRHYLLRASRAVEGRAFPLYEEVYTVKSKEKSKRPLDFMTTLKGRLAADCRPILVSDAGFRVPEFKLVESFGGDWVGSRP